MEGKKIISIRRDMPTTKLNRHWQFCIGSGHAALALRADYLAQLKQIHEELGIQYVRFHGILNDDMQTYRKLSDLMPLPGAEKLEQISFRKVGLVYDHILSCGLKPYVEVSFLPKHLASTEAKCGFYYGGCISPPREDAAWSDFIQRFVEYLIRRYGETEVESWPFEIWNEPDVFVFWSGTKEEYFHLYEITARAIKAIDAGIRVGGPATSGSKWIGSFLTYCRQHNVPLDFISTHQYAGDPIGGVEATEDLEASTRTEDMGQVVGAGIKAEEAKIGEIEWFQELRGQTVLDGLRAIMPDKSELEDIPKDTFRRNSERVREQIRQGWQKELPLYYSEWNENAIFSAYTNDTRKVAAYLIKAALDTEQQVTGSSVWCFSDIFEEFSEFPQEFHGGFGLMTHSGIPKPQYYAMKLLGQTCENRIDLGESATDGEIGTAAFTEGKKLQIVLFRQKMKNLKLPKEAVTVEAELAWEPNSVTIERIDEGHCNPLKLWEAMGAPEDLRPKEQEKLKSESAMYQETVPYEYQNGKIQIETSLGVNDVVWITIKGL